MRPALPEVIVRTKIGVDRETVFNLDQLPSYQEFIKWQNRYHPILPFCFFTILVGHDAFKAFILRKKGIISQPRTLGEHLRSRRLLLDLRQEDVARQLGTLREVYDRWERDERVPVISEWPRILVFLSYYPFAIITPGDLVLKARRCQGFDQKRLAKAVGVIHQRLRRWERGFEPVATSVMDRLSGLAHLPLITSATCSLVTAAAGLVEQQVTS